MSIQRGFRKEVRANKPVWIIDFRFTDKNGRKQRHRRDASVQTATAAASEARRLMSFALDHGFVQVDASAAPKGQGRIVAKPHMMTFSDFVEGIFTEQFLPTYKESTRNRYKALLRQGIIAHLGGVPLNVFDATHFRDYALVLLKRGVKLKGPLTLVRTILTAAVSSLVLDGMPVLPKGLVKQTKKLPLAPSRADVDALIDASPRWLQVAIGLAAFGGLRSGEIRALEVRDLQIDRGRIHVRQSLSDGVAGSTKGDAERWVPIPAPLLPLLENAKKTKLPSARVFVAPSGKSPNRQHLLRYVRTVQTREGLALWTVHSLRHFFCSEMVRQGVGIETVRVMAGHTDIKTSARYLHASEADLKKAASIF